MNVTTKEGVEVKVGQIWRDLGREYPGRHVKVLAVELGRGFRRGSVTARVVRCEPDGTVKDWPPSPKSTLSIDRMHKGATGWALVEQP